MTFRFAVPGHKAPQVTTLLIFALVLLTSLQFWFSPYLTEEADMASNALQVERASEGRELLGPYSRFGFSHPGPIAFYGQALAESIFGWLPTLMARHLAGQLAVSLILILWTLRLLQRASLSPPLAVAGVFLLVAPLVFLGGGTMFMLANIWGPLIVVFPVLLFVVAVARLIDGDLEGLPAAALGANIAYQTHLMTIPVLIAGFTALAVIMPIRRHQLKFIPAENRGQACVWSSLAIMIVGVIPILIEQIKGQPGNLTLLWRFVRDNESTTQPWSAVLHHLGQAFTDPLVVLFGGTGVDWNSPVIALVVMVLLGGFSVVQYRRSAPSWRLIVLANWVAIFVTVGASRRVHDELYTYLFYYLYSLVGLLYLIVGKEIWDRWLPRRVVHSRRAEFYIMGVGLLLLAPWLVSHDIKPPPPVDRFAAIVDHFGLADVERIHLAVGDGPDDGVMWKNVPTYALRFRRNGVSVTVEERFVFLCGKEMRPTPDTKQPLTLMFTKQKPSAPRAAYMSIDDWVVVVSRPD